LTRPGAIRSFAEALFPKKAALKNFFFAPTDLLSHLPRSRSSDGGLLGISSEQDFMSTNHVGSKVMLPFPCFSSTTFHKVPTNAGLPYRR